MDIFISDLEKIFYKLVLVSIQTSALIAIILAIKGLLGKRLPAVWHYGLWIAFYQMRRDREFACDAKVLKHLNKNEHKSYGYVLLSLTSGVTRPKPLPGLAGIIEFKTEIKRRIEMIATFKRTSRHHSLLFAACFMIIGLTSLTNAASPGEAKNDDLHAKSKTVATLLAQENYVEVTQLFDPVMEKALPPNKLQEHWETLENQSGEFQKILKTRFEPSGEYRIIFVTCAFEKSAMDLKLVYNQGGDISGMWIVPPRQ